MVDNAAKNLTKSLEAVDNTKQTVKSLSKQPTDENRIFLKKLASASRKRRSSLGLSWRYTIKITGTSAIKEKSHTTHRVITFKKQQAIREFWLTDVSREIPHKVMSRKKSHYIC